jgi:small nuclear ribonucleoprotein (snRNP)-like protein
MTQSQIDLSQFVNKKVRLTLRDGREITTTIKEDTKVSHEFFYSFNHGSYIYPKNGCYAHNTSCGWDIVEVEEVTDMQTEVGRLRDEIGQLKKMVLNLRNDMVDLKQSQKVSPRPFDEINLLEFVGKQVVITFRNGRKDYGTILQTTGYYPIKLRGWNTDMTCYNDGRQLLDKECDYDIIHVETLTPLIYDRLYEQMQKLLKELNSIKN